MPLTRCPICGNSVSDKALSCPHCGQPFNTQRYQPNTTQQQSNNLSKPLLAALAAAVVLLLGLGFYLVYSSSNSHNYNKPLNTQVSSTSTAQPSSTPKAIPSGCREYTIDSREWGYAWVRSGTDKHSETNKVKKILNGERFYGKRMDDNPDWMEVYDLDGNMLGYMYYKCARIPKD
ncbi:MAG: zinc ribbon domain-containing protein [Muribaculaceae bacterium]|nr:zinc ribbon domain-containing protein [Muribaculaceae bacterium]